jgi:N-acetylglucosamine-6-sulfatase
MVAVRLGFCNHLARQWSKCLATSGPWGRTASRASRGIKLGRRTRGFLCTLLLILCPAMSAAAAPNIVVILTDDQDDTGSMNYMPKTLSLLAGHGITFTNSFVNFSLCAPSRSSFLTGQAAHNDGIKSNKATHDGGWNAFKKDEGNALPDWLKAAGYKTALLGKYVNGYAKGKPPHSTGFGYWANAVGGWFGVGTPDPRLWVPQGWDLWYVLTKERYYDYSVNENGTLINFGHEPSDYATDVVKDRAARFIKDEAQSTAPFFMLIATKAPHGQGDESGKGPAIAAPKYEQAFKDVTIPRNPAFYKTDATDKDPSVRQAPVLVGKRGDLEIEYRKELQSLQSVDDLVESVVGALRDTGKLDNTLIVYTSDNGFLFGEHGLSGKDSPYEGSIKVPLVIRGPGVPENQKRSQLVNNLDIVATIEDVAGTKPGLVCDGHSLVPLFADANAPWRSAILIEGGNDQELPSRRYAAVRSADKKYIKYASGSEELYDLTADPYELENKAHDAKYAADLTRLRGAEEKLRDCEGSSCWIQ